MDGSVHRLRQVFAVLYDHYGPQHWWPAESPFEVMVGAILTQNTAWSNVEKAIAVLQQADCVDPCTLAEVETERLAGWLRPVGYFNIKARRLQSFCRWYLDQGRLAALMVRDTETLRRDLLSVNGVGPETADDILLYAFDRPVFVIDTYTRRLFARLGLVQGDEPYECLRTRFQEALEPDAGLFNEYHALIVHHTKQVCCKRPLCRQCALAKGCPAAEIE